MVVAKAWRKGDWEGVDQKVHSFRYGSESSPKDYCIVWGIKLTMMHHILKNWLRG